MGASKGISGVSFVMRIVKSVSSVSYKVQIARSAAIALKSSAMDRNSVLLTCNCFLRDSGSRPLSRIALRMVGANSGNER